MQLKKVIQKYNFESAIQKCNSKVQSRSAIKDTIHKCDSKSATRSHDSQVN